MEDLAARRAQLTERLHELEGRLRRIETRLDEPPNPDFGDRATERGEDQMLEDLGAAGLAEIRAINAALRRIEDGSYGYCVNCGEPIDTARLDVVPHAPRCRRCA